MSRERVAETALRALPATHRSVRGEEILATLLDSSAEASPARFAREVAGLVRFGLRARDADREHRHAAARRGRLLPRSDARDDA